jgi:hypothetical protein
MSRYIEPEHPVTLSVGTLATLAEYATSTDGEVDERGMAELDAVLVEVRPLIGWDTPDQNQPRDYMQGNRGVADDNAE